MSLCTSTCFHAGLLVDGFRPIVFDGTFVCLSARRLVLTHFSARYGRMSEEAPDPAELLGEEARRSFNSPVVVAQDFMVLQGDKDFEPDRVLAMKRPRKRAGPSLCSACGQGQSELVV